MAVADHMRERGAGPASENARREQTLLKSGCTREQGADASWENAESVKSAKMRPSNAGKERELLKCDRTREQGAEAVCENAGREYKLQKCARRMLGDSGSRQNAIGYKTGGRGGVQCGGREFSW